MYRFFVELLLIQEFSREAPELEIRLFPFLCQGFDSISSSEKMEAETAIHLEDGWAINWDGNHQTFTSEKLGNHHLHQFTSI